MTNDNTISDEAVVLDKQTPEDVAKALIEGGRQKEPFYIFDMDEAYRRIDHFQKMMPRVQIFYAMKSNDSDKMIKMAASLGLGFDCASPGEIKKILKLNVSPLRIIFAVPTKTPEWMIFARESGIRHTTFDTSYELKKMKQYWPTANLLIRIKVESDSIYKLGDKFGCDFETEAVDLLEEAATLGLKVIGVAFHVGSACYSKESYEVGMKQARALFDHEAKAGRKMNILDIGGGFMSDQLNRIDEVAKVINQTIDKLFPEPDVQIIAEPGRYISDSSFKMYCNINNVRRVTKQGEVVNMIYINDGIYGTLRFIEPWTVVKRFERRTDIINEKPEKTILWGPSCDSTDRVMLNLDVFLPRCTPFDWLIFTPQGAYTFGFASRFSCLGKPEIRAVISQKLWLSEGQKKQSPWPNMPTVKQVHSIDKNKLKSSEIFEADDFVLNADISTPLPSSLPSVTKNENPLTSDHDLRL